MMSNELGIPDVTAKPLFGYQRMLPNHAIDPVPAKNIAFIQA